MAERVGIFISHHRSTEEDAFTERLKSDLEAAGADVWVDYERITYANFVSRINEGLAGRQWLVLILTPAALNSSWVQDEVNAALNLTHEGVMRGVIPFMAQHCDSRGLPPLWAALQRYDATRGYEAALAGLFRALGLTASPTAPPARPKPAPVRQRRRTAITGLGAFALVFVAAIITLQLLGHLFPVQPPTPTPVASHAAATTSPTAVPPGTTLYSIPFWPQNLQGWTADVPQNRSWSANNGNLVNDGSSCCLIVAPYEVPSRSADYGIEASLQMVSCAASGGSFGLFGRGTPANTSNGGYAGYVAYWGNSLNLRLRIAPDHDANRWTSFDNLPYKLDDQPHLFRAEFKANVVSLSLDGSTQMQQPDPNATFPRGGIVGIEDNACQIKVLSFRVFTI